MNVFVHSLSCVIACWTLTVFSRCETLPTLCASSLKIPKNIEAELGSHIDDSALNVDCLVREVINRNPDLAATRHRIRAASAVVPRVQTLDDPQFLLRSISHPIGKQCEFTPEHRYKFMQRIPFPGKLRTKGKIASHIVDQFRADNLTTQQDLILQSKRLYFQLYFNSVARDINTQNQDIINRLVKTALAVYKTGRGSQADVIKANIELQRLEEEWLLIESEGKVIISMINTLLDRDQQAPIGNPKALFHVNVSFPYKVLERIALHERPELHRLKAMVDEQKAREKLAKLNYFPDFDVEFMLQDRPEKRKKAWGVNFGFNIPIWIGRKQYNEAEEARAYAQAQLSELSNMKSEISGTIKELLAQLEAVDERIKIYESGLLSKTVQLLLTQEAQYRTGKINMLTVLDTQRQLQDIELEYERTRVGQEIILVEIERAVGVSLSQILAHMQENKDSVCSKKEKESSSCPEYMSFSLCS